VRIRPFRSGAGHDCPETAVGVVVVVFGAVVVVVDGVEVVGLAVLDWAVDEPVVVEAVVDAVVEPLVAAVVDASVVVARAGDAE
jgi:hypothetical protein